MSIRILLADDHALLRMGLSTLLGCERDMKIVGEAADGEEAVECAAKLKPDVVIMDLAMPKLDGVEATRQIRAAQPETRVLVLTSYGTSVEVSRALAAGASGVIVKDASSDDLPDAIRKVAAGERILSPELIPEGDETTAAETVEGDTEEETEPEETEPEETEPADPDAETEPETDVTDLYTKVTKKRGFLAILEEGESLATI